LEKEETANHQEQNSVINKNDRSLNDRRAYEDKLRRRKDKRERIVNISGRIAFLGVIGFFVFLLDWIGLYPLLSEKLGSTSVFA
jgi:hypothetical protein